MCANASVSTYSHMARVITKHATLNQQHHALHLHHQHLEVAAVQTDLVTHALIQQKHVLSQSHLCHLVRQDSFYTIADIGAILIREPAGVTVST